MLTQKTEFSKSLRLPAQRELKNLTIADFLKILESVIDTASLIPESDNAKNENTLIIELKASVYSGSSHLNKD